jgi:hypothetical protein
LDPRKRSIQIALREIIASFDRGYHHLDFHATRSILPCCSGSELGTERIDVVDDEGLESLL